MQLLQSTDSFAEKTSGTQMPRRIRATPKQAKLIRAVIRNPNATLDELGAQSDYHGRQNVNRALKAPAVQAAVTDIAAMMEETPGLRTKDLLKCLKEGLNAEEEKFFSDRGRVRDTRTVKDFPTRKNYLELAVKMKRFLKQEDSPEGDLPFEEGMNGPDTETLVLEETRRLTATRKTKRPQA